MGWSMPDEREKFTLDDMIEHFNLNRVSLGGPIFDVEKLRWLNGLWIRESLNDEDFIERAKNWAFNQAHIAPMVEHIKSRVETLSDIAPLAGFMFSGLLNLTAESFAHKKLEETDVKRVLQFSLWLLEAQRHWTKDNIFDDIKTLSKVMNIKMGDFMQPIFIAIAGTPNSWSVVDSMALLGPDMSRARLRDALDKLGGFSKKETKRVEKEFQEIQTLIEAQRSQEN
jgi:glutamyl-tRNA synthetase